MLWLALAVASGCAPSEPPTTGWETLEPGLAIGRFHLCDESAPDPPSLVVLRADPEFFRPRLLAASAFSDREPRSIRQWAADHGLVVATNAGMFHPDYIRHVGLMIDGDPVQDYRSVLAFGAKHDDAPPYVLADLDETPLDALRERYSTLIQNLRMVDAARDNVWEPSERRNAVAALGIDGRDRLLFLFSRTPRSVHDLVDCLLELPIDLERAQYLEGGPEAVLFVRSGEHALEFRGSWSNASGTTTVGELSWPIPNVLGLVRNVDGPASP
jgi:hypothetical protein